MDPTIIRQLATQTCSVDNITIMRGQVMRLNGIRAMIWASIREAEQSKDSASLVNNVLFGLQMVKATCDVVIAVGSELIPGAEPIGSAYQAIQPASENLGKLAAGQTVTGAEWGLAASAGVNGAVKHRLGYDNALADVADLNKIKADIVINATAHDEKAVIASFAEYGVALTALGLKAAGNLAVSKVVKGGEAVLKAGAAYFGAYNEWKKGDMDATFDAGIELSRRQLTNITIQISIIERDLAACGQQLSTAYTSSVGLLTGRLPGPTIRAGR